MTSKNSQLMIAFCVVAVCVFIPLSAIGQAAAAHGSKSAPPPPGSSQVVVTNTPAQPVPTAAQGTTTVGGTVNIGNTPSVFLANTPSVNVANTPNVNVANSPTVTLGAGASVNVTNPLYPNNNPIPLFVTEARNRWEDSCFVEFSGASGSCLFQPVPANTVLLIREFDASGVLETGVRPQILTLETSVSHYFPAFVMAVNSGGFDSVATHQETYIYLNQTTQPACDIVLSAASNAGNYHCSISGYLVPVF
ncbi:MAG TPA: hypothetical protein VKB58_01890 [Terriglobales bacterium]|jgi:hypothetical protein|nr:hypothetical protein [Terriglobales bacterium]